MVTNRFGLFSDKYLMPKYFTGYLPQGSIIVTELNPEHTYVLPASKTLCFPFAMRRYYQQLVIDVADTTPFESCFIPAIRCWPSTEASGESMTSQPRASQATINPGPYGAKWNFYLLDQLENPDLQPADINRWINSGTTYWMNVQNLQNKESYFFLRFTFYGVGITHVE